MNIKQYLVITGNYWAFTLTDGALRMLVVLYFHQLGYAPLEIAALFLFYEVFGVITNLVGGYLGARIGLNRTMQLGLALQVLALLALTVPVEYLTVIWVMAAQALSGIAKDLNKMSAKSAIKLLVPNDAQSTLYKWVAILTGSKNALKGVGFFLGGVLLTWIGFAGAMWVMLTALALVFVLSMILLTSELGVAKAKPKFKALFSKSAPINVLAAARLFLFGARDVWFVIALPIFLSAQFDWDHWRVGAFLAIWVIFYGFIQAIAPRITGTHTRTSIWAALLAVVPAVIALGLTVDLSWLSPQWVIIAGLLLFALLFAINSSLHSYLIIRHARADGVSLDVGFYYMANALGRLVGTVLSGVVFQYAGLVACLWVSFAFLIASTVVVSFMPGPEKRHEIAEGH
ncbi:organoarsenical effux MFS transporter ArsJ [Aliidiomarina celeris]|uniref:organoarsenical effux MFS transporter ArsJ n=1 Tax=Aliidiomarina celeris TaxID=2249428 RepID=UPI000DEB4F39|nr:organoarsenical effux MFS transporter ArsJ [Aliidiomarina celeris]